MSRPVINPGNLIWSGEHWIDYLREDDSDSNSGMVSLYHTRYSASGEGNVAFVDIPGKNGICGLCTDNPDVGGFVHTEMVRRKGNPFDRDLPLFDAEISRGGDIRTSPTWSINTNGRLVVATWSQIQPPIIAEGPAPTFREDLDFFTLLFFCDTASIELDGAPVPGRPYPRDIWRKSIGGDRSSCVFALAETSIRISATK